MKKLPVIAIICLVALIAGMAGLKFMQIKTMISKGKEYVPPPEPVTTAVVQSDTWQTALTAVGTLSAVQGVTVSAELSGKIVEIAFTPGAMVQTDDLLVRQDTGTEAAQLLGATAQVKLARIERDRAAKMVADKIVSQAEYDSAVAAYDNAVSVADNIRAVIAKKTIRAPFAGRLGIRQVNLGQMINEGTPIVTLQVLDPVYVDFTLPQQLMARLHPGLSVTVTCDAFPEKTFEGPVTTVNPVVDVTTRNIQVQATVPNPDNLLRAGMFVTVSVGLPDQRNVLIIPSTAVLYAPYGDSVFIVEDDDKQPEGKVARQQFVRLGEKRGDFSSVLSGVAEGDTVVSTGVFKLRNGQAVVIDNKSALTYQKAPAMENN